jgi:hypothetical protein
MSGKERWRARPRTATRTAGVLLGAMLVSFAVSSGARAQDAQLLVDLASTAESAGADTRSSLAQLSGALRASQTRGVAVALPPGRCVVVVARAAAGLENVDVEIARGRTVLARDTETGRSATARHCAGATSERVEVRARAFRGAGAFALAAYLLPPGEASSGASSSAPQGFAAGLLDRLASLVRASSGGMSPLTAPAREVLVQGQRVERDVTLVPGRCYRVIVAAEDGVMDVDLALRAPGARADETVQTDGTPVALATLGVIRPLCPALPGTYRLALTLVAGTGAFAWQLLGSVDAPAQVAAATPGATFRVGGAGSDFVAQRLRARHAAVGEGREAVTDARVGQLRTSESREEEVRVEGGRCYVVLGAGAPSAAELDLLVRDALGNELARDAERDAAPRARFCPLTSGPVRVVVRMARGYGAFGVQVFGGPR